MKPVIAISADSAILRDVVPVAAVYDTYVDAVVEAAGGLPWIVPPLGERLDHTALLEQVDGIVLTGAISNVHPERYGETLDDEAMLRDPARDATAIPLIHGALSGGIPLFAICRGFHELNVALGGTLHQRVHEVAGMIDHREPEAASWEDRFVEAHEVMVVQGGVLSSLSNDTVHKVNSLHHQGISRLAPDLRVEARADDWLVEAASVKAARSFAIGVQWHPEWGAQDHPLNAPLWQAFGSASHNRRRMRYQ